MFKWQSAGCLSGNSPLYIDIYVYISEEILYNMFDQLRQLIPRKRSAVNSLGVPVGGAGSVPSSVKGFEI